MIQALHIGWYGIAVGALLLAKLLASLRPRRKSDECAVATGVASDVHGVITCYNEDPEMLRRCLDSILLQVLRPASFTVIDDCSDTRDTFELALEYGQRFTDAGMTLHVTRFGENLGKRHGLARGFEDAPDARVYVCIDSDTVLEESAVSRLINEFDNDAVNAVTGLVLAHNRAANLLTRLIDMRYQNAFLGERVAYSRLGSVLCVCGSLAAYRGEVVRSNLEDFLNQRFLGRACTFGDDRRLTYYALTDGKSLIQPAALAWTDVPDTLGRYLKQQCRWTKSFLRESVLLALKMRVSRAYWWLNLVELGTWTLFTSALLVAVAAAAQGARSWPVLLGYGAYVSAASWLRSVHYLRKAGDVPTRDRLLTFLSAPLYALMNLTLLIPLRLYAIGTLRRNGWGTRAVARPARAPRHARLADTLTLPVIDLADTREMEKVPA